MENKKNEVEVILLGCLSQRNDDEEKRLNEVLKMKEDWAWITGQLIRHRINGNFLQGISEEQCRYMPRKVYKAFDMLSKCYSERNKLSLEFVQDLLQRCDDVGITVAALKGAVFTTSIYSLTTRMSNDIDLLVLEDDLSVFDRIMREMGFIQTLDGKTEATKKEKYIQRVNYHDIVPYYRPLEEEKPYLDGFRVDINFQFDTKENEITKQIIADGRQKYVGNGFEIWGLKLINHVSHLCVHFYREASNSIWTGGTRDVDLYKLVDIENTMRILTDEQFYSWIDSVKRYKLLKPCYFTLYYLNEIYPSKRYDVIMNLIRPDDMTFLNQVNVLGKNQAREREVPFFEKAFDMNYCKDFAVRDIVTVD